MVCPDSPQCADSSGKAWPSVASWSSRLKREGKQTANDKVQTRPRQDQKSCQDLLGPGSITKPYKTYETNSKIQARSLTLHPIEDPFSQTHRWWKWRRRRGLSEVMMFAGLAHVQSIFNQFHSFLHIFTWILALASCIRYMLDFCWFRSFE